MTPRTQFVLGAVLLACVSRTIPHPPNFAPMTAIALFGAAALANRRLALLTPLAALFVSDLAIEALHRLGLMSSWGLYPGMWVTYAATFAITCLGFLLRGRTSAANVAGATLAGSCFFFVFTNFAVWASGGLYPRTFDGLVTCYTLAIPFFGNALLGDAVYATALFGGLALAQHFAPSLRPAPESCAAFDRDDLPVGHFSPAGEGPTGVQGQETGMSPVRSH